MQPQKDAESKIKELGAKTKKDADKIIKHLYQEPIIDTQKTTKITGKPLKTAYELIVRMEKLQIIKEINQRDGSRKIECLRKLLEFVLLTIS